MSEYWKSNAKFYCRFCNLYITDNKSTRNIHDSGTKHKENVERFLREQSHKGKKKEADTARMNKDMDAIEKAALKQYKLDVEAGLVQPTADMAAALEALEASETTAKSSTPASKKPDPTAKSSSSPLPKATGSNSEPLASSDHVKEEETVTPPKPVRDETVGQAGAWEVVEAPAPVISSSSSSHKKRDLDGNIKEEDGSGGHTADDDDDGAADPEDLKGFKIVEKTYPVDGDDDEGAAAAEGSGGALFKKRKGGSSRNIRRK